MLKKAWKMLQVASQDREFPKLLSGGPISALNQHNKLMQYIQLQGFSKLRY